MTRVLDDALKRLDSLPADRQDEVGRLLLTAIAAVDSPQQEQEVPFGHLSDEEAMRDAIALLDEGFDLGGRPLNREELYEERIGRWT